MSAALMQSCSVCPAHLMICTSGHSSTSYSVASQSTTFAVLSLTREAYFSPGFSKASATLLSRIAAAKGAVTVMYNSSRRCPHIWARAYSFSKTFPFVFSLCMSLLNAFTLHCGNRPHILNNKVLNFLRDINLVSIFHLDERGGFRSNLVCVKLPPLSVAEAECA